MPIHTRFICAGLVAFVTACPAPHDPQTSVDGATGGSDAGPDAQPAPAALQICRPSNPHMLGSAYTVTHGTDWVNYACAQSCGDDWTACTLDIRDQSGNTLTSPRDGQPILALAFTIDGMGGHFAFTSDGDDVLITHAGAGGTNTVNTPFENAVQTTSTLKTVTIAWEPGMTVGMSNPMGWFTRTSAAPTNVRQLVVRPAAAIRWVKDNLAVNRKLGTTGSSMGTVATFGAHVWYDEESIIDYQLLIGGPGIWDVNAGCGRTHLVTGHCDLGVTPCTGAARSSFGDNDPACTDASDQCRVPTVMANLPNNPSGATGYSTIINYVGITDHCQPLDVDDRDPDLDQSSLAMTVSNWSFHGRIDLVANEGGNQPPNADQGMGEGHAMELYSHLTGARGWTDNQGAHHGDSWDIDPVLIAASAKLAVDGMAGATLMP